jgi:uncharacterized protein YaaR (DUF327 family)
MDKIDGGVPFFNPAVYAGLNAESKKPQKAAKQKASFFNLLEKTDESTEVVSPQALPYTDETIKELLDAVHSAGDALKNHPLSAEILQYKSAVKNFLRFVVENSYTVEKQYIGITIRKRKEKTLVMVVDQKLEQLATSILTGQTAQLEILARLEEITGILIDLFQ